jgi:phosphonate transport system ATP-binding protein
VADNAAARPVVDIAGLTKVFDGGVTALDDLSLQVDQGELLVLIGLSGAGKSTLLRHVNGLTRPTSGTVRVLDVDVNTVSKTQLRSLRKRIGFIFQQFNLVRQLTALENVLTGGLARLRGPRFGVMSYPNGMRREAMEQLDRVGIAEQAFQRAATLSGGQQQRVAIARTLFQKADLVLADEPVASLDPEASEEVMEVLFRVCREDNLTVMCSLHQVDLALGWADRMVGMRDGRIVLDESAHELPPETAMMVYRRDGSEHRHERSERRRPDAGAFGLTG